MINRATKTYNLTEFCANRDKMERSGFLELVMHEEIYFNKLSSKIPLCSKKLQNLTSIRYMKFKVSSNQVNAGVRVIAKSGLMAYGLMALWPYGLRFFYCFFL